MDNPVNKSIIQSRRSLYDKKTQTTSGVYQIGTAGELYWFAGLVNGTLTDGTAQNKSANAVLTADITVNSNLLYSLEYSTVGNVTNGDSVTSLTPIGNDSYAYTGTFDGRGYTISGLYFNDTATEYVGLFGFVGENGSVSNVGVVDSYFNGKESVGGVCGKNYGTITNCYNTKKSIQTDMSLILAACAEQIVIQQMII